MYPDLSYLFHDLFGTPVDNWLSIFKTFGLMLAVALFCTWILVKNELVRMEKLSLITPQPHTIVVKSGIDWKLLVYNSLIFGFVVMKALYVRSHFPEFQADPAPVLFSLKGNILYGLLGTLVAAAYNYYSQKQDKREPGTHQELIYPHQRAGDIIIIAGISGVFGAKLFSIFENLGAFFQDPLGELISGNGLNIYGGLILAFFAVLYFIRKLGIKPLHMMDIGGMGIMLGYAVGRMGCQLSGDGDWGIVAAAQPEWWFLPDWMWSYTFPNNVNNDGVLMSMCDPEAFNATLTDRTMPIEQRTQIACGIRYGHELKEGVYPTSVYETIMSLIFFAGLWLFHRKVRIVGLTFFLYMIINGIERWFIETIRVNEKYDFLGLNWSQAQYISVLFVIVGIIGFSYIWKNKEKFKY